MPSWYITYDIYSFDTREWLPSSIVVRAHDKDLALILLGVELAASGFSLIGEIRNVTVSDLYA
jgi:hypothetical protein